MDIETPSPPIISRVCQGIVALETALEITLTQKLRIRPFIIVAPNFEENPELQTPTVY